MNAGMGEGRGDGGWMHRRERESVDSLNGMVRIAEIEPRTQS